MYFAFYFSRLVVSSIKRNNLKICFVLKSVECHIISIAFRFHVCNNCMHSTWVTLCYREQNLTLLLLCYYDMKWFFFIFVYSWKLVFCWKFVHMNGIWLNLNSISDINIYTMCFCSMTSNWNRIFIEWAYCANKKTFVLPLSCQSHVVGVSTMLLQTYHCT